MFLRMRNSLKLQTVFFYYRKCMKSKMAATTESDRAHFGLSCNSIGSKCHKDTKSVFKSMFLKMGNSFKMLTVFFYYRKCMKSKMAAMTEPDCAQLQ